MLKKLFIGKTCSGECRKMQKRIKKILQDFDKNEVLKSGLLGGKAFVVRRFLLKELACLEGIENDLIKEESE